MSRRKTSESDVAPVFGTLNAIEPWTEWSSGFDYSADGLISWRSYVAVAIRDVQVDDVVAGLVTVIAEMEMLTTQRILELREDVPETDSSFGFPAWLPHWQDHFRHWQDPVRQMLGDLCVTPDARFFGDRLHAIDGQVLLDFLLQPCCDACWPMRRPSDPMGPLYPASALSAPSMVPTGRKLEQLYAELYRRFRKVAPFATAPTPEQIDLGLNYDRLCPEEMAPARVQGVHGDVPC